MKNIKSINREKQREREGANLKGVSGLFLSVLIGIFTARKAADSSVEFRSRIGKFTFASLLNTRLDKTTQSLTT